MPELAVELYGTPLGTLTGDWRSFDFAAHDQAVRTWGLDSAILSVAAPLALRSPRANKARRQNVFHELLPEGRMLARLANHAGVQPYDTIGMLARYGRDIAGALTIWDRTAPGEPREPRLEPLDDAGVARMLADVAEQPLGNDRRRGRTSLAGVQDKIVLARAGGTWSQVLDGYPSTHILKPASADYPALIFDEEYGSRLAAAVSLARHATRVEAFAGVRALVIERFDRAADAPGGRLHQEDFNQALGARGDQKYQSIGGVVTLGRIAGVLAAHASPGDRERLLQMVTLAVAVGNLDCHAKNLGMLHFPDGRIELAPAYDVVPQAYGVSDGLMALAVDGVYVHAAITRENLVNEGRSWGMSNAERVVTSLLEALAAAVDIHEPLADATPGLSEAIAAFTRNLLDGRAAGA